MALNLSYRSNVDELMKSVNIAKAMSEADRQQVGLWAKQGYDSDKSSRSNWERKTAMAMELALQVVRTKSFPWPNCSNIKFPLITVAALHFHARAYPAIVPASGIVKAGPVGYAPEQALIDRASRVGAHMSYQLQRQTEWEAETDRALLIVPIIGCAFKKTEYDPTRRTRHSRLVLPQNLVVDYYTTDLRTAFRVNEYFTLQRNEVRENVLDEVWLDNPVKTATPQPSGPLEEAKDKAQGLTAPTPEVDSSILHFIEQHTYLDLDGDGYDEPYIVTFDRDTGFVRSIRARYLPSGIERKRGYIFRITPVEFYTKLPFIPSPDGGFYDLGFGQLLGPLNDACDSLINMLVDAGTMSNLGGGFLGRGMKIKKGTSTFVPLEWKTVDSVGDDISKNIYPLPVRDPSKILLELMVFLIGYAERIAAANDVQMGDIPGHNVKAQAMEIADANGARIYAAIFKRLHRAIGDEFRLFYKLNALYPPEKDYERSGKWFQIQEGDYVGDYVEIDCAADRDAVTDLQKKSQANIIYNVAKEVGGHNMNAVVRRVYAANNIANVDEILPKGEMPPPPNTQLIVAQARAADSETKRMMAMSQVAKVRMTLQLEAEEITAKIILLYAQAEKAASEGEAALRGQQIALLNTQLGAMKDKREGILRTLELLKDQLFPTTEGQPSGQDAGAVSSGGTGTTSLLPSVPSMEGPTDDATVLPVSE